MTRPAATQPVWSPRRDAPSLVQWPSPAGVPPASTHVQSDDRRTWPVGHDARQTSPHRSGRLDGHTQAPESHTRRPVHTMPAQASVRVHCSSPSFGCQFQSKIDRGGWRGSLSWAAATRLRVQGAPRKLGSPARDCRQGRSRCGQDDDIGGRHGQALLRRHGVVSRTAWQTAPTGCAGRFVPAFCKPG